MTVAGTPPARTGKPVVLLSVLLTALLCALCMVGYTRLFLSSTDGRCSCTATDVSTSLAGQATRNESLTLALASITSAKQVEERFPVKDAEPSGARPASSPTFDGPAMSKEEIAAKEKADAHTLDLQLLSEQVDPIWASKVERATAEAMVRVGSSVRLDEVSCRETLCRAKVTHLDPKTHEADLDGLLSMPVIAGQAIAFAPSNDDRSTVLFFARKGMSLSVLQPSMQPPPPELISGADLIVR